MLTQEQVLEIREHLEKAQNPIFFFDNDCDGLMAFLLFRRYIGRGRGVPIKSFPELDESYISRIDEFNSDYVFVLDKPQISKSFIDEIKSKNLPLVWIDHHNIPVSFDYENVSYYNPTLNNKRLSEPTSYLAYKIIENKKDMWLALIGCISDNFMPEFAEEFAKKEPELYKLGISSPFQVLYETRFGKLIMILNFGLKDRTTNVISMINLLINVSSPYDILNENEKNFKIIRRYEQINKSYQNLLDKAKKFARSSKKVIFFQYGGELSLSADISNELYYRFPGKVIIVAYLKGDIANVSVRGNINILLITQKAIKNIVGATGGGHEHATGAKMDITGLQKFKEFFEKEVEKNN
ncbi:MAG TPA: DHHA1 domain-containing protein [Candidatus Paceibacterota bacterium]|nr:DHHA1 domain-containing protein [Candidatus Paceibacterota bacterium]